MKAFAISVERKVVDEHNTTKSKRSKLLIRAEDASDAVYKAKQWLAENTEKGLDYEVLNCSTNKVKEVRRPETFTDSFRVCGRVYTRQFGQGR